MKQYLNTSLTDFVNESKSVQLKRQYKKSPSVIVESAAPVRNKVIEFLSEHKKVSKNVLRKLIMENFNYKNANAANAAISQWFKRNEQYFITENKNGVTMFKLSNLGNKLYNTILNEGCNCTNPKKRNQRPVRNINETTKHPKQTARTRKMNEAWYDEEEPYMGDEEYDDMEDERDFLDRHISSRQDPNCDYDEEGCERDQYGEYTGRFRPEEDDYDPRRGFEDSDEFDFLDNKRGFPRPGLNDDTDNMEESGEDDFFEKYGEDELEDSNMNEDDDADIDETIDEEFGDEDTDEFDDGESEEFSDEEFDGTDGEFDNDEDINTYRFISSNPEAAIKSIEVSASNEDEARSYFETTFGDIVEDVDSYSIEGETDETEYSDETEEDFSDDETEYDEDEIEESDDTDEIPPLTESRKAKLAKLIKEMKSANKSSKLNEEELLDDEDDLDSLFSSIKDTDDETDSDDTETEIDGNSDDIVTDTDDTESADDDDKVEITEFILSVDDPEAAIAELAEIGVDAELVEDEGDDLDDTEDIDIDDTEGSEETDETDNIDDTEDVDDTVETDDTETFEGTKSKKGKKLNEGEIRVSADNWDALRGWLEEKGVDIESMFDGEIEVEDTDIDDTEEDLDDDADNFEEDDDTVDFEEDEDTEDEDVESDDKTLDI